MNAFDRQADRLRKKLEGTVDFEGQELAEQYQRQILWSSGAIAFLVGFVLQSVKILLLLFAVGVALCLLVTGPSYSSYNQHPIQWLPTLDKFGNPQSQQDTTEANDPDTSRDRKDR